jgi:FlaA1/EpsC-like NDP-sugar epimerase
LCRQIIGLGPKRLVLFEMSELALYNIERELRTFAEQNALHVELVGLIGNGHHKQRMREIFRLTGSRRSTTPRRTSTCPSSSKTSSKGSTTM